MGSVQPGREGALNGPYGQVQGLFQLLESQLRVRVLDAPLGRCSLGKLQTSPKRGWEYLEKLI